MPREIKICPAQRNGSADFCVAYQSDIYCETPAFLPTVRLADRGHSSSKLNKRTSLKVIGSAIRNFQELFIKIERHPQNEINAAPSSEYFTITLGIIAVVRQPTWRRASARELVLQ